MISNMFEFDDRICIYPFCNKEEYDGKHSYLISYFLSFLSFPRMDIITVDDALETVDRAEKMLEALEDDVEALVETLEEKEEELLEDRDEE